MNLKTGGIDTGETHFPVQDTAVNTREGGRLGLVSAALKTYYQQSIENTLM